MIAQQTMELGDLPLAAGEQYRIQQRDAVEWLLSLAPGSVDLLISDPAYESLEKHRAKGTTTRLKVSAGSSNEWFPIFPNARFADLFAATYRALKRDAHFYMMCDQETAFFAKPLAEAAGFKFWKGIVWDKVTIGLGYHYRSQSEMIMFFEKGKRRLNSLSIGDVLRIKRLPQFVCDHCRSNGCAKEVPGESIPPGMSRSRSTGDAGSLTISSGKDTTGQSQPACRSTTRTKTGRITPSTTSNSSILSPTEDCIQGQSSETAFGGSRAHGAESSSLGRRTTITSFPELTTRSSARAGNATPSNAKSESKQCAVCGSPRRRVFPTEKPVALSEILIGQSSEPGEIIADPFMGSGSVGVAALQQGRRFIGSDISEAAMLIAEPRIERAAT